LPFSPAVRPAVAAISQRAAARGGGEAAIVRALIVPLASCGLSGCTNEGAPSYSLFGAFFPAWMFCAVLGIFAAIGARAVFVLTGLSSVLPFQLFVCASIGVCFALLAWLLWFGQ
jgi:hypothetical protein